jgi:HEPN domain-containing protein
MMSQHESSHDRAVLLMRKAAEDEALLDAVLTCVRISDEIIGFHLQQAAEKLLKAILANKDVDYRRTHNLIDLMVSIEDEGIEIPSSLKAIKEFIPFAVEYRYEQWMNSDEEFDRCAARELLRELRVWAESLFV